MSVTDKTNDVRDLLDAIDAEVAGMGGLPTLPQVNGVDPLYYAGFASGQYAYNGSSYNSLSAFLSAASFAAPQRPRFRYSPDGAPLGILMEGARTNLIWPSNDFTHARWAVWSTTVTAATGADEDGVMGMAKLSETATTALHQLTQNVPVSTGARYTHSILLKAGTVSLATLWLGNGVGAAANVDLAAGTIDAPWDWGSSGATEMESHIEHLGSGVYRCSISAKVPGKTSLNCGVLMRNAPGVPVSYAGNTSKYLWVGKAQTEQAPYMSSYIPTMTAPVSRITDSIQRTMAAPSSITQLVHFRTGSGIPNDVAGDDIYATFTHIDNNDVVDYSDLEVYWYQDGHVYVEIHEGVGNITRAKVDLGYVAPNTPCRVALTASAAGLIASLNGGAAVSSAVTVWPTDLTRDRIGQNAWATARRSPHSTLGLCALWPGQVASAVELEALAA